MTRVRTPSPPRLLAVFPDPPWRADSGSSLRDLEHLRTLVRLGIAPTVLCFVDSVPAPAPPEWLSCGAQLLPFVRRPDRPPVGLAAALRRGVGYMLRDLPLQRFANPRFAYPACYLYDTVDALRRICEIATQTNATAVLLRSWFLSYAKVLKEHGLTVIIDAHDAQARAASEIFRTLPPIRRWLSLPMVIATRRLEARYLRYCDEVWAPSAEDVAYMRAISAAPRFMVYPNLVALPDLGGSPGDRAGDDAMVGDREEILFIGNMAYPPNAAAATFLVTRIVPALRQLRPNVVTTVVGKDPPPQVVDAARADPNILVVGCVPDVAPFYRRAAVVAVPIQQGAGTRVKVIEALAFGKAVVTTQKGVEGIRAHHGTHLLVADDPGDFARSLVDLLADPGARRRLGNEGRNLVRAHYADDVGCRILAAESALLAGAGSR